jgi:hypothetical protein
LTSPVDPGDNATAKVKTAPGAECFITVEYKSGPSTAGGLEPKTANSAGAVSWTWRVGPKTSAGEWPVAIECTKGDTTDYDMEYLVVR